MKNIIIFLLILACAFLAWLWLTKESETRESPIEKAAKETVDIEVGRLAKKSDSLGREHAIFEETRHAISQAGADDPADTVLQRTIDSLTRLLGIERRNFRSYTQVQARIVDSLMVATRTERGWEYSDKWVSMGFTPPTPADSAMFAFAYNAEVNWLQHWKRKTWLSPKRPYMDIWLGDGRATVNGVKRLVIEPPVKTFGVDVMAVGEYYRDRALIGGGISVDAGRFRVQGNYLYDPVEAKWRPAIRGGFKLMGF